MLTVHVKPIPPFLNFFETFVHIFDHLLLLLLTITILFSIHEQAEFPLTGGENLLDSNLKQIWKTDVKNI